MSINLFQIVIMLVVFLGTFFLWLKYKYKLYFIYNFFIGGGILILLCKLEFLGFKGVDGKFGILVYTFISFAYLTLNISNLFVFLFSNKKAKYFLLPSITFFAIVLILMFYINPYENNKFEVGILIRLFLAFFPLQCYTYFKKYILN